MGGAWSFTTNWSFGPSLRYSNWILPTTRKMLPTGDVGSLALGGGLGMCAVFTKNELLSAILGGVFFVEAVSVVVQVTSFKLTGRRIFLMAPIHHHFEKKGWPEPKIIVRFWIISILLALFSLSSLKLR